MDYSAALAPVAVFKPAWLSSPEVTRFIEALRSSGIDLVFSGGAVRDAIRDPFVHPKDFDVFANAPAETIHKALTASGIESSLHVSHNQLYVRIKDAMFDVFRLPTESDDTSTWLSPEGMRDKVLNFEFSINTPVLTPTGDLYDFFGALSDIQEKRVRFLVDPMQALEQFIGPRLIMRYFRFCAQFLSPVDTHAINACKKYRDLFASTDEKDKYYIRKDSFALMEKPCIPETISLMQDNDMLGDVYGLSSVSTAPIRALMELENGTKSPETLLRRIGAMVLGYGRGPLEGLKILAEHLQLDEPMHKKLHALLNLLPQVDSVNRNTRRTLVKSLRKETLQTLLLLRSAAEGDGISAKELYLSLAQMFSRDGFVAPNMAAQYVAARGGYAPYALSQCYGFSLVEMSIVIVIIGLILGSILVGRDLIHASEIRAVISQMDRYNAAVNTFRSKYNCLPGDCTLAQAQTMSLTTVDASGLCVASGTYPGDGNGIIGESTNGNFCGPGEELLAWQHLKDAQLFGDAFTPIMYDHSQIESGIPMIKFGAVAPSSSLQGGISILPGQETDGTGLPVGQGLGGTHLFWFTSTVGVIKNKTGAAVFRPEEAFDLDEKVDDGYPLTGSAFAAGDAFVNQQPTTPSSGSASSNSCVNTDTTPSTYDVKTPNFDATSACSLMVQTGF